MKHFYEDIYENGHYLPSFEASKDARIQLAQCLDFTKPLNQERHRIGDLAYGVMMDYDCQKMNLGGRKDWRTDKEPTPEEDAVKRLFLEFIDAGYIDREFPLFLHSVMCGIQICASIPMEQDDED